MRRTYVLSSSNPAVVADLPFTPSTVLILNNTDQSVYMNIGRAVVPSATFFDLETLPAANGIPSNVALPNNSDLFALFLPTPTDVTKTVTVTFQGTSDPFSNRIALPTRGSIPLPGGGDLGSGSRLMGGGKMKNYLAFRLNDRNLRQQMELAWFSDQIFILNNSDGWLYFREGGVDPPTSTFYDIPIPPKSYTILNPRGGWQFAATLDNPTDGKDCFVIYAYGYADEYRSYKELIGEWDWYLPPLTVPTMQWFFDWQFAPPINPCLDLCLSFDFTFSDYCFLPASLTTFYHSAGWSGNIAIPPGTFSRADIKRDLLTSETVGFINVYTDSLAPTRTSAITLKIGGESGSTVYFNSSGIVAVSGVYMHTHVVPVPALADYVGLAMQFNSATELGNIFALELLDGGGNPINC